MRIKVGDRVIVIAGKDRGKEGIVKRLYCKSYKILVEGINFHKKNIPKSDKWPSGSIVDVERPISVSNVMLKCPKTNKRTRIGYLLDGSKKSRFSKKASSVI